MFIVKLIRNLRILPRWVIIFIDLSFVAFSCILAYLLRFNFSMDDLAVNHYWQGTLLYTALGLLSILLTTCFSIITWATTSFLIPWC